MATKKKAAKKRGSKRVHPVDRLSDKQCRSALRGIFDAMDGVMWSADTLDEISMELDEVGLDLASPR